MSTNMAPIGGVARVIPVKAQEILGDPKATPEQLEMAFLMEEQIPCDGTHVLHQLSDAVVAHRGGMGEGIRAEQMELFPGGKPYTQAIQ
jgi:hypothetical protein